LVTGRGILFKIRLGDDSPHIVGEVSYEEFIDQINGPEDKVYDQQDEAVVVIPAYHQGVDAQDAVDDTRVPVVHCKNLFKTI
jgi:hypothetical protein